MDRETAMATELLEIAKGTTVVESPSPGMNFFSFAEKYYDIDSATYPTFQSLPKELLSWSKAEKQCSLEYIARILQGVIVSIVLRRSLPTIDDARSRIVALLDLLATAWPEQTVIHELHGVIFIGTVRPFTIAGVRVARFTSRDKARLTALYKSFCSRISDRKERGEFLALLKERVDLLGIETVVWCTYAAEDTRARELSLDTMHWVVILFRYAYMAIHHSNGRTAIGIAPHLTPANLVIARDHDGKPRLSAAVPPAESLDYFPVFHSTREKMRKAGVFVFSSILEGSDNGRTLEPRSFRFTLLQALRWTVDSLDQTNNASKILAMTVGLETLFSEDRYNLGSQVADGTAMVLARDPVEREKISKKVKDLYDKRSAVTHGRGTSVSDADVLEMQDMATSVIAVLCHHADDYSLLRDFWRAISLARRSGQIFK